MSFNNVLGFKHKEEMMCIFLIMLKLMTPGKVEFQNLINGINSDYLDWSQCMRRTI